MTQYVDNYDLCFLSEDLEKMKEIPGMVFRDWEQMDLKPDLSLGVDFYLLDTSPFIMLKTAFVFNLPIMIYKHEFSPFKLNIKVVNDSNSSDVKNIENTFLIGP